MYSEQNTPTLFEATGGNINNCGVLFANADLMYKDNEVANIFKEVSEYFVIAVNNAITLFDPRMVVFSGRIFGSDVFRDFIKKHIAVNTKNPEKDLYVSKFELKTGYIAGCSIAVRELFVKRGGFDRQ